MTLIISLSISYSPLELIFEQIVVAAGDGAKASLGVKKYLQGK